jgi:hypothetical protein
VQGFTIDKDGKITANGIKIEKVLVDGEEFFGDDPTVATKNIDAAAVDKFQVFDKKSDQATFTGIDDGSATRTINFKLKEDRKRGVFGKLELGVGPDDKWNNSLMANAFRGKRKFSFFGIMSSTGKTGLGWDESNKYGGDNTQTFTADDGNTYIGGSYDDFESIYGSGIPKSWSAGINYGNKYNEDKQNLNGSLKYGKIVTEGKGTTNTQSILPGVVLFNKQASAGYTDKYRNSANLTYEWMFDSSFSAKLSVRGYKGNTKKRSIFESEQTNETNKINSSNRRSSSEGDDEALSSSLIIRKKFKKPGQTISLSLDQRYTESNTDGYLYSLYDYYDKTGTKYRTDTTDQEKINGNLNKFLSGKLAYTQPISKAVTWELSYGMGKTNTESKLLSYDKANGKYSVLNKLFSNSYAYDVATTTGGTMFRYNSKKTVISVGGDITRSDIKQQDIIKDSTVKYAYNNLFPRANFTYKFSSNRRISFNYNGNTRQPSITQIQPVADNTNPNNIQLGNPALIQEFNHSVGMSYNDYKTMTDRGINISFYYTTTANAIRNNTFTDPVTGKTTYQYINTNGNYNYNARFGFNRRFKNVWDISIDGSYSYREAVNTGYVNSLLSKTHSATHALNIGFAKNKDKKFDVYIDLYANYNKSHSTIRPDVNNNYWTYNIYSYTTINFPGDIDLGQDIQAYFREASSAFSSNNNVVTWNISLAKKLFKDKKSEIRLKAFDVLDQNKGVSRNTSTTTVTETTFETLHRYYQLSFTWNFIKNPALAAK